ncbi:MAG: DUF4390 domain-containing protein [Pseudomonadota bacterium]
MPYSVKHSLLLLLLLVCLPAWADGIQVKTAALRLTEGGYALDADFDISINPTLEEALNKGVALYFVGEFELVRSRWYWPDEKVIETQHQIKLTYNALTQQYRLGFDSLFQNFATLHEAVAVLSNWRERQVGGKEAFQQSGIYATMLHYMDKGLLWQKGVEYQAALRLRLDVSQLPKPFQINALASREWDLDSDWFRWSVVP